jgi:hypothetical protein
LSGGVRFLVHSWSDTTRILTLGGPRIGEQLRFPIGNIVSGVFTPVLAKHTKHLSLVDILSVGVDRMRRNFERMNKQVAAWKGTRLPDESLVLVDVSQE